MKILTDRQVARYIAAPMIGIGILGATTLGLTDTARTATGNPGTSQTFATATHLSAA